jgi:hypothetical protein
MMIDLDARTLFAAVTVGRHERTLLAVPICHLTSHCAGMSREGLPLDADAGFGLVRLGLSVRPNNAFFSFRDQQVQRALEDRDGIAARNPVPHQVLGLRELIAVPPTADRVRRTASAARSALRQ